MGRDEGRGRRAQAAPDGERAQHAQRQQQPLEDRGGGLPLEAMKAFYNNDKATGLRMDMSNKERTRMCDEFLKNTIARSIKKKHSIEHYVALAKIAENLKAMSTSVRNIGRTIATYD